MTTIERNQSPEAIVREYLRLRHKHAPRSQQAKYYREAIRDQIQKLRAMRLARQANTPRGLPALPKAGDGRQRPMETGSAP